jgi:hypothetical protein
MTRPRQTTAEQPRPRIELQVFMQEGMMKPGFARQAPVQALCLQAQRKRRLQ